MCLIAIAIAQHPDYPVVIAANRDEFYERPTAPLDYWADQPNILAGRDFQSMGTWLGISTEGRIGAITNYRSPESMQRKSRGPSRGLLVSDFLKGPDSPAAYLEQIHTSKNRYEGFNLLVGDTREIWWYSNITGERQKLSPGIHGISNHLLNTPWPKVKKIKAGLASHIENNQNMIPEELFERLGDQERPPDHELPDTGIGLEWEQILSPIFITSRIYGTRSSSIIFFNSSNHATFYERTFIPKENAAATEATRWFDLIVYPSR